MKYYIYDIDKLGIKEFDQVNEVVKVFMHTHLKSSYMAIGISKPSRAVDIMVKERVDGKVILRLSKDFLSSSIYKEQKEETLSKIRKITEALGFSNSIVDKILETEALDDELEM